jgi:hypothetical protein
VSAATTAVGLGLVVSLAEPAMAAPATSAVATAAAVVGSTVTLTTSDERTIYVDQTVDLPTSKATVKVHGVGFDPATPPTLQVAICLADGNAPVSLTNCLGGEIPGKNGTDEWGVVATEVRTPPPAAARWKHGKFDLTLTGINAQYKSDDGSVDVDCLSEACSLYVRAEANSDRSQDFATPIRFKGGTVTTPATTTSATSVSTTTSTATSSSSSSSSTPTPTPTSTSTSSSEPTTPPTPSPTESTQVTVQPLVPIPSTLKPGATQEIVFERFKPGEVVQVTLFSDPIPLPNVRANDVGNVTITLTVPEDLPPGSHTLQAIGTESGTVGIAQFTVAAVVTTTSSPSPTTSSSPSPTTSASPTTSSAETTTSASPTSASPSPTTTAATTAPLVPYDDGPNLLWLWLTLGAVAVVGIVVGVVALVRRRREQEAEELAQQEAELAAAATAERNRQNRGPADDSPTQLVGGPGPYGPPPSPDGYGLLSGRDNDYPPMPPSMVEGPTQVSPTTAGRPAQAVGPEQPITGRHSLPDDQHTAPATGPQPVVPADDHGGPSTQAWKPDFATEEPKPRLTDDPLPSAPEPSAPAAPEPSAPGSPGPSAHSTGDPTATGEQPPTGESGPSAPQ